MKDEYEKTHIGTYRYKCKETKTGFPVRQDGNFEPLVSFKDLPAFQELKKTGRKWKYTKNYKPVMDRIVMDIDCEDGLKTALNVTKNIMQDLADYNDCINVYFSGSKGTHIEILTDELNIIDTTVEKPMDSCNQYVYFLNFFMDKYPQVDLSLKDVGTRLFRKHHTKHKKTGNYKILIDSNASIEEILESSKANKDMVEPKTDYLDKDTALKLLNKYSKPVEKANTDAPLNIVTTDNIFVDVFNELQTNLHNKILLMGAGLNGYVTRQEVESIYHLLSKHTNIEDSTNAKGSFIEAYEQDRQPCNLGQIYNHYRNKKLDLSNFYGLSSYLEDKKTQKNYDGFIAKFDKYDNDWFNMLETELYDYVDNTNNVFIGIINSLSALFGYGSRFVVVNGGSEVGKSEYINAIKQLMPKFKNLGSSTPASIRRQNEDAFNKKIVYLGDKGLKGKSQASKDEFEGLYEVFGGLITDKEFVRDIVVGNEVMEFNLKSDGVCVFYTEPYTNLRVFGAGDQYTTRSTFITVNPVKDGLAVFLQDQDKTNPFYNLHNNYIQHILKNPLKIKITDEVKTEIWYASKESLRTAKYLLGLFKAYCQYIRVGNPLISDVEAFLTMFNPQNQISMIEEMVYKKLYKNLKVLFKGDLDYKLADDGAIEYDDMLMQIAGRREKSFFTAKQIKTYFKKDFTQNQNLKDTIDQIPQILHNLYNAGYLEMLNWQYYNQNVYYIPYNEDMD